MASFIILNPVKKTKTVHVLKKDLTKIGRLSDNDIILKDSRASRYHAEVIHKKDGDYLIKDLYSSNGIKVNDKKTTTKLLEENDKIKIASLILVFRKDDLTERPTDATGKTSISVDPEKTKIISSDDQNYDTVMGIELDQETVLMPARDSQDAKIEQGETDATIVMAESPATSLTAEVQAPGPEIQTEPTMILERPGSLSPDLSSDPSRTAAEEMMGQTMEIPATPSRKIVSLKPLAYRSKQTSLLNLLLKNGNITEDEMNMILSKAVESSSTTCQILYDMSLSHRRGFIDTIKSYFGLPFIETDDEIVKMYQKGSISEETFRRCASLSVKGADEISTKYISVIVPDPLDLKVIDDLTLSAKKPVKPVCFSTPEIIKKSISRAFKSSMSSRALGTSNITVDIGRTDYSIEEVSDFPIVDMVNYFVHKAMMERASDIHLEPAEHFFVVRNRIDGVLHEAAFLPNYIHPEVVSRLKIICDMNVAERRLPQDGRFSVSIQDKKLDVRVSTLPTVHGEKIVLRLLEQDAASTDINDLGLDDFERELFLEKIQAAYGMILLTGPTGSGKTTTLYSALSTLNTGDINILTVEDPVEYKIAGVYQMQANEKIGLTFASGLRTMLRQDPDVIMVGEIRDLETAEIAIRAALTGHIVFSTLHTNDAIGIVLRLTDMGIDPFLVSSAITLAIAQRLYRTICEDCRSYVEPEIIKESLEEEGITESRLKKLGLEISEDREYAIGKGCPKCKGTGYFGRKALFEMFNVTQEAKDLIISKDFTESAIKKLAVEQGMTTLLQSGRQAVERGLTTIEEIIRVCGEN